MSPPAFAQQQPMPGFAIDRSGGGGPGYFSRTSPTTITRPSQGGQTWVHTVGAMAKKLGDAASRELYESGPFEPRGQDAGPLDQATAAAEVAKRSPTLGKLKENPEGVFEELTGTDVDTGYKQLTEEAGDQKLPEGLSRKEKGQILMELGLRIMTADPKGGLIGAIGQAGLGTMGTYRDMQRGRTDAEREKRKERRDVLKTGIDIGLSREKAAADQQAAAATAAARQSEGAANRQAAMDREQLRAGTQKELLDKRLSAPGGAGKAAAPPADVQTAQWLAQQQAGKEGRAATEQDFLAAYDRVRQGVTRDTGRLSVAARLYHDMMADYSDNRPSGEKWTAAQSMSGMEPSEVPAPPASDTSTPEGQQSWGQWIRDWLPGSGEQPQSPMATVEAAPAAAPEAPGPAVTGQIGGPAMSSIQAAPREAGQRRVGEVYRSPDGKLGRWNGQAWELVQ